MIKKASVLIFVLSLCLFGLPSLAGSIKDIRPEIDKVMARFVELEHFSGTVLVARTGQVLYAEAFGEANKDHGVPNTMNTRFELGSIAKVITGTAFMKLVETGIIGLENPVVRHISEFPFGDKIRIIHLLTHTSGLPDYTSHHDISAAWARLRSIDDFLPFIFGQKLKREEPGQAFEYNSSGFILLGAIMERMSGKSFRDYIRDEVFVPCGMTETSVANLEDIVPNRAIGYVKDSLGRFKTNAYYLVPFIASAGIQTTAGDLLKFDRALTEGKLLKPSTLERMGEPYLERNWGTVWRLDEFDGRKVLYHGGETAGVSAMYRRYPEDGTTLIILSNYHRAARPIARALEAILFGKPYEMPRPTAQEFLYRFLVKNGGALPEGESGGILKDNGYEIPSPGDMNGFGYELLDAAEIDRALEIFRLSTRLYPKEANAWDSLAEAYLRKGDREAAVRHYQKALEINPKLSSAKTALDRLKK
jgi:CubicO group peptidase (beta-lactamase class C family)